MSGYKSKYSGSEVDKLLDQVSSYGISHDYKDIPIVDNDKIVIDYNDAPYAKVILSGSSTIYNLYIDNTKDGDEGYILVFQTGFKQIALGDIVGKIALPLRDGTIAMLIYNNVDGVIYIRSEVILGDEEYPSPQRITDFQSVYYDSNTVSVQWTAPYANNIYDDATQYDMRYSNAEVDANDDKTWAGMVKVKNVPLPAKAGTLQSLTISGLSPNKEYYLYIKSIRINYGVEYISEASNAVFFKTIGSEDVSKAYRIKINTDNIYPQSNEYVKDADGVPCHIGRMVDEEEKNKFLSDGYPDVTNKDYSTYWLQYKYGRDNTPLDIIIDMYSIYTMDKLYMYTKAKQNLSIWAMKDIGYDWERIGGIKITFNAWSYVEFKSYQCRFVKISFDLMDFGMQSTHPVMNAGDSAFPEPQYNETISEIENILLYGRPSSPIPEGIMSPLRRSTGRKSVDQFFCTNGHFYQQGRIHSMCSGEKVRLFGSFGHFSSPEKYTKIADRKFKVNKIAWVSSNNGTGDNLEDMLRKTYKKYGLKPYLTSSSMLDETYYDKSVTTHNRSVDNYWYPGAWKPVPTRGVGGLDDYYKVTQESENYKTYAKLGQALSSKYGKIDLGEQDLFYPDTESKVTGLDLLSGVEVENEPDANWNQWVGYENPKEYAAILSSSSDGHEGTLKDEYGNVIPGIKVGDIDAVSSGTASVRSGYFMNSILSWKTKRTSATIPIDCFSIHRYCSNSGNQEASTSSVQYGIPFEESAKNSIIDEFDRLIKLRNRMCPDKEIWVTEFGWGEAGVRESKSKYQCYSQSGRIIDGWTIPDRHRSDVKGTWIVRACLYMMDAGIDMVNYYSTECEGNYFGTGLYDSGAGFEMFHWNDIDDQTPGAKVLAIQPYEVTYARGGFATLGLFGQILGNGAYPITRAYWHVATFRNRLKDYVYIGRKYFNDDRIVVACFKKVGEDKGAYAVYLNDNQNTGLKNVEIPVPDGVSSYNHVTVYVPEIPSPEIVPSSLATDRPRTGMAGARHEVYTNGAWQIQNKPYYQDREYSYAQGEAVYPENPQEGDEVVVLPTSDENPYFPLVGPVRGKTSSRGNLLAANQYEADRDEWDTEPDTDADGNVIWSVKTDVALSWRQVEAVCDYINYHTEGQHGSYGDEVIESVIRGNIYTNITETPEYYFFDAIPDPDYKSEVENLTAKTISPTTIELWWNNTNTEDTGYEVFVSSLPNAEYAPFKTIGIDVQNKISISGLSPNTTYYYKIRPIKGNKHGVMSDYVSIKTYANIAAVTDVKVTKQTATTIALEWDYEQEQDANFVSYAIYRSDSTDVYSQVGIINDQSIHEYVDKDLSVGKVYKYRIRVIGLNGLSEYSNIVETRTLLPEECSPVLKSAITDKLGTRINLMFDLPIGLVTDLAKSTFTLTEDGNLRLITSVKRDESNYNNLIISIPEGSLSDYIQKKKVRIMYSGGEIYSEYNVPLDPFSSDVAVLIGNFTDIEAIYQINLCGVGAPQEVGWNNLERINNNPAELTGLTDTYGRTSDIKVKALYEGTSYKWGGIVSNGSCEISDIPSTVYISQWQTAFGAFNNEAIKARLHFTGLNNEHRYTFRAYGGTAYGSSIYIKMKINDVYTPVIKELGNKTDMMVIEDVKPVDGEISVDFINPLDTVTSAYSVVGFVILEEYKSTGEVNNDVWIRELSILEDDGLGVVKVADIHVDINCIGIATDYRISESQADLSNLEWISLSNPQDVPIIVPYHFDEYGDKTLYVQVKNQYNESNVRVISIEYKDPYVPVVLKNIYINEDEDTTFDTNVKVLFEKDGIPTHYRLSETDISSAEWIQWPDSDVIQFLLSESGGLKTVYGQIKDDKGESSVRVDSITYIEGQMSYEEFDLNIPLSSLGISSLDEIDVQMPDLKYDKKMAYNYTMDDGKAGVYHYFFKHVKDNNLCYTDGCGNDLLFSFGNAWITYNYSGTDLHKNPLEEHGMLWSNLIKMLDYGSGVYNHGGGVYDNPSYEKTDALAKQSFLDNRNGIISNTGISPFIAVVPGGSAEYMAPFLRTIPLDDNLYDWSSQSFGGHSIDVSTITPASLKKFKHGRTNLDTFMSDHNSSSMETQLREAYNRYDKSLFYSFSHSPGLPNNVNDQETALTTVYPYLDWIYNTYGKGGDDSIWVTCADDIQEYLFTKANSTIDKSIQDGNLVLRLKMAIRPEFYRKDICIKIKSKSNISPLNIEASDSVTGLSYKVDEDLLFINASTGTDRVRLAEKYTSLYESDPTNESRKDAYYMINRLRESLRQPYLDRMHAMEVPPVLNSIEINSGDVSTKSQEVSVKLVSSGYVSEYLISEDPEFTNAEWVSYVSSDISFTLSGEYGVKTIYAKVRNAYGQSDVKNDSIEYIEDIVDVSKKAIISFGYSSSDGIPSNSIQYDQEMQVSMARISSPLSGSIDFYDTKGIVFGQLSNYFNLSISSTTQQGNITGDNSGVYPDKVLQKSVYKTSALEDSGFDLIIPDGKYKFRLLVNTKTTLNLQFLSYSIESNGSEVYFTIPSTYKNNFTDLSEVELDVVGGAQFRVDLVNASQSALAVFNSLEIERVDVNLELLDVIINSGETSTQDENLSIELVVSGDPDMMMVSEYPDFLGASWQKYESSFSYRVSGIGTKNIYAKVKKGDLESTVKNSSIELVASPDKLVVSFGWAQDKSGLDVDGINRFYVKLNASYDIFLPNGVMYGSIYSYNQPAGGLSQNRQGAITGDNSFDYSDEIMERNVVITAYNKVDSYSLKFNIPAGKYRFRLFSSTIATNAKPMPQVKYELITSGYGTENETSIQFDQPEGYTYFNNISEWLELETVVPEEFQLRLSSLAISATVCVPLNILEIISIVD